MNSPKMPDRPKMETWRRMMSAWRTEIDPDIELLTEGLFTPVLLRDVKGRAEREPAVAWWPSAEVRSLTDYNQRLLNQAPGSRGLIEPSYLDPMGPRHTVRYLWRHRHCVDEVAAILCCASLFLTLFSRSKRNAERRAAYDVELQAFDAFASQWIEPGTGLPWHASSSCALPDLDFEVQQTSDFDVLAADLAREHKALLRVWRPVRIEYSQPD